ncbi:amino acid adenylation domain-containing protein [Flavobacterium sp.]|uniref:non-ribosomal peptide synthetase n=1 Tax=Flavobacterium sp. TaxID=239 RepID=UPI003D0C2BBA
MNKPQHLPSTILVLLNKICNQKPQKKALVFNNESLSYEELDLKSNQLANYLKTKGNFLDVPICFSLEQSLDKVIVMLAIWKASGGYVSLDPLYPQLRLKHMLEDSKSPILITTKALVEKFDFFDKEIILIDDTQEANSIKKSSDQRLPENDIYDAIAYFAYTSGSTGLPKAVMAEHKGLVNFVHYFGEVLNCNSDDIALNISSSNFDGIVLDLWVPLSLGITVYLYPDNRIVGDTLLDFIRKNKITVLPYLPVSILATLPTDKNIGQLRKIFTGGEAPSSNVVQPWRKLVSLINMYGPTETTVVVCTFEFSDDYPITTIGKPLTNVDFYVLDDQLRPLAKGEIGQLYIGGVQASRGYLNQSELTAERFVYYTNESGERKRVYKTGDLVRMLSDGNIEFTGRADQQVKIRGFRVELSEIENTIRKSGLVENSCVIVKGDSPDNKSLLCYYKKNFQKDTFPEHIRTYLYENLPSYMIPSRFLLVENFPLTSNGKIDRTALSNYDADQQEQRQSFTAPFTQMQNQLAEIWKSFLGIKTIGINDNFFHFGGNSILAYKLVSSIRQELHLSLQIADLFLYPTIYELENYIITKGADAQTEEPIIVNDLDIPVKLSFQQQSLWFLDKLQGSLPYHIGVLYPVTADISITILEKAFRLLIQKHNILRTVILQDDNSVDQSLISAGNWTLQRPDNLESLQKLIEVPFNLERDYMLRACLIQEAKELTSLFIVIHHIATDGWSMSILISELNELYNQILDKKESIINDNHIQYRHYANWQLSKPQRDKINSYIPFWKNYLEDVPVLQIARDFPKEHFHNTTGRQYHFKIDSELTSQIQELSREQNATLYMTLLSAFGLLMQHYSGQHDICIGSPAANRIPSTVDQTIGYFVNTLPIRIQIDGNPVYTSYLEELKKMLLLVFQHQEVPLETIINNVIKDRFAGYNPLFQTIFVLQDTIDQNFHTKPIDANHPKWIYNGKLKFDLQFEVTPIDNELQLIIEYADALFKESTIVQMTEDFTTILKSIVGNPQKRIGDFEILLEKHDNQEPSNLLSHNENAFEKTLVGMFEDQVKQNPEKIALLLNGAQLSYQELHLQSNKVAHQLIAMGVKNNEFVACYLSQSIERIIALLGIIKAGAAYVPLDTNYPIARVNILLRDTNPALLITDAKLIDIGQKVPVPVLDIEHMLSYVPALESQKSSYTDTHSPSDLIYVIHTSGTTGIPKGVLIEHKAISNFIIQYGDILEIGSNDRTLQFSPYNFDGSIIDIWIPLAKGATVYLYPNNKLLGDSLSDFIAANHLTVVPYISPSVLSTISLSVQFPHLRVIGTGGETCPVAISKHWMRQLKLVNGYGPTETTVAVNHYVYDHVHPANTLGNPIDNMKFYVLDHYMRKVPDGVTGELYISGIQLSRGYLNQPELTTERFITNPFIKDKNSIYIRMYKTGDQVRILPDGMLEYVGRTDHQVKIRGYRIEVAEIETALQQVKGIKNVVVQVHKASQDILSLRAFITGGINVKTIKDELSKKLPFYMIPNQIIPIEAVPVTANGKLDTTALSLLADKAFDQQEEELPVNSYEETIRDIWSEVLERKITSLRDDFFHLGGHSLLLTRLYNKISKHYPCRISLSELYINNTIKKLALLIQERELSTIVDQNDFEADSLSDEIKQDAYLDPSEFNINLKDKGDFENPKFTLLTGVTGFVGINMLSELLESTSAVIYLLIRADNEKHARERLLKTINEQLLPVSLYNKKRVKLITGDLSKPFLGLSPDQYDKLTKTIDVVYHAGSAVNFIQPYSYMKAANIGALHTIIKFATNTRLKQICLLSTVGVYSWEHYFTKPALIMESDSTLSAFKYLSRDMGYIQSKWVMEQIALQAIKLGIPIIIFRLGYTFCHSITGATAKYQWWSLLVKCCVQLKHYPILLDQKEELVSVDFISKSIAHISKNPKAIGEIFHLSPAPKDNMTVMEFFETLQKEFDTELTPLPYQQWMKLWENDEKSPLYPLLSLFKFKVYDNKSIIEIHQNTPDFDISNTLKFLEGTHIDTTIINRSILEAYCKYLDLIE